MITKITIINFRSYEHTVLELDPHVNVFVGKGQAGKTNIKRSIEWVMTNRPRGTKFISWWADGAPTSVVIEVVNPDGLYVITMTKDGKASASYILDGPIPPADRSPADPDPVPPEREVFTAVGTQVPERVRQVLNMDAVNIQSQLDQPYLVTGNKGDISRAVNRVIQAEIADNWLSELNSRQSQNTQQAKTLEASVTTQQGIINRLNGVDMAGELIIKAEMADNKRAVAQRRAEGLGALLTNIRQADETVRRLVSEVHPLEAVINSAEAAQEALHGAEAKAQHLSDAITTAQRVEALSAQYYEQARAYTELLREMGQCPTCLNPVSPAILENIINHI